MRIFVWMLLVMVLVGCASAPAPADDTAWIQCVRLMERSMYQERDYMVSLGLPYHYQTLEQLWEPCDSLRPKPVPFNVRDEDPLDRTNQLLGLGLLNQAFGARR